MNKTTHVLAVAALACAAMLAIAACAYRRPVAPIPQQRDWYFIRAGYRLHTTTRTVSTQTSVSYTAHYKITTTTTTQTFSERKGIIGGIERPRRAQHPISPTPGDAQLLRTQPQLATQPFKPISEQP